MRCMQRNPTSLPATAIAVLAAKTPSHCALAVLRMTVTGSAPDRLVLLPDGQFEGNGVIHNTTPEAAALVVAKVKKRQARIVIDYEHQTLNSEYNGQPAPAAGWVDPQSVEYVPGEGVVGDVSWTKKASTAIEADEYAYVSPVFPYDDEGQPLDLWHLALTNNPAIVQQEALNQLAVAKFNPNHHHQETDVDKAQLIALLGLAADAGDSAIETALATLKSKAQAHDKTAEALGLADSDDVAAKVATLKSNAGAGVDLSQYAPLTVVEDLKQQVAALKSNNEASELETLIAAAQTEGKLVESQIEWARSLGEANIASLKAYIDKTPAIAALARTQSNGNDHSDKNDTQLDETAVAVCKQMGIGHEDYLKTQNASA